MFTQGDQILESVLELAPEERRELLEKLSAAISDEIGIEKRWAAEAEDRLEAYRRGEIGVVSANEIFAQIARGEFP